MDPVGIFMLKSVNDKFDLLVDKFGINFQVELKSMHDPRTVIDAITNGINPVVLAINAYESPESIVPHAMVATGFFKESSSGETVYFLVCKNSHRDDPYEPGIFHHSVLVNQKLQKR